MGTGSISRQLSLSRLTIKNHPTDFLFNGENRSEIKMLKFYTEKKIACTHISIFKKVYIILKSKIYRTLLEGSVAPDLMYIFGIYK